MDTLTLQRIVFDALEDVKAQNISVFNTEGLTDLFDRVFIASGTSNRQTRALAIHVHERVKAAGGDIISTEGQETGEWVLVDTGDIVVHIMQPAIRQYYNLEELWGGKVVDVADLTMKKAVTKKAPAKKLVTESEPKKVIAGKASAEKAPEKKSASKSTSAKKPATKKPAAKTSAAKKLSTKKPVSKTIATKKPA